MTDSRQFGGGKARPFGDKVRQFGDRPGGEIPGDSQHCAECEAMLADALDGTLSAEDQATFDKHAASCEPCGQMIADARRGAAWLELLRDPAPEPPVDLLERILAQTSWSGMDAGIHGSVAGVHPAAMHSAGASMPFAPALVPGSARVLAFPRQTFAAVRRSGFGQIVMQPRLAMTAAMAFFSIALTLNLTGVHPAALRMADLAPGQLRRDFFSADARVVQYYEGLRVVYELESRVHDLQSAQDTEDAPAGSEAVPAGDGAPTRPAAHPEPIPSAVPAGKRPRTRQRDRSKDLANPRTSRREDLLETHRTVVAETLPPRRASKSAHANGERRIA